MADNKTRVISKKLIKELAKESGVRIGDEASTAFMEALENLIKEKIKKLAKMNEALKRKTITKEQVEVVF